MAYDENTDAAVSARADSLLELADRVEKATGPDRGLDALITIALNPTRETIVGHKPGRFPREAIYGPITEFIPMAEENGADAASYLNAPAFTSSLDAAMTLVPEDLAWKLHVTTQESLAHILPDNEHYRGPALAFGVGCTPALALTAAALRTRAAVAASETP